MIWSGPPVLQAQSEGHMSTRVTASVIMDSMRHPSVLPGLDTQKAAQPSPVREDQTEVCEG